MEIFTLLLAFGSLPAVAGPSKTATRAGTPRPDWIFALLFQEFGLLPVLNATRVRLPNAAVASHKRKSLLSIRADICL